MKASSFTLPLKSALLGTCLLGLVPQAHAVVLTFEGVASPGGGAFGVSPYSEGGFTLTVPGPSNAIFSPPFNEPPSAGFTSDYFTFNAPTTFATLAASDASPFTLNSLDLGIGAASGTSPVDITLTGNLSGGGIVSTTFLNVTTVSTFTLDWGGLASLDITATDDPGIDNVVLNSNVQSVPDGGTTAVFLLPALAGIFVLKRRSA